MLAFSVRVHLEHHYNPKSAASRARHKRFATTGWRQTRCLKEMPDRQLGGICLDPDRKKRLKQSLKTINGKFLHDAVDWKIIDENPFLKVKTQKSSVKVNEFVPREVVDKLMKKANPVWQVILALSRYGGLRTPSETLSLRW
ncbi:MAG: hypothetical protein ACKN9S_08575 [Pirellula sp.]